MALGCWCAAQSAGEADGASDLQLLTTCEDIAVKTGARWLWISALAANEQARSLYHRFGFADHFITLEKPIGNRRFEHVCSSVPFPA
jgi:hypothetical protein